MEPYNFDLVKPLEIFPFIISLHLGGEKGRGDQPRCASETNGNNLVVLMPVQPLETLNENCGRKYVAAGIRVCKWKRAKIW